MSDDDEKIDPGRMSAPAPDFDDDDIGETRLTPGDELARWRRMAAREAPTPPREPSAPPSRPLIPGGAGATGSDEKTPERGIPATTGSTEMTPPRGTPMEVTPARPIAALDDDRAAANPNLKDGPIAPRLSPVPGRLSPVPARSSPVPPRASPPPSGPRVQALPQNPRTSGPAFAVFGAPPRSGEAPIPLTERRSVPPPSSGSTPLSARPLEREAPRPKPALQPPPPTMSLPPIDRPPLPSIPPAPPLGFSEPPQPSSPSMASEPAASGRGRAIAAGLVIVAVAAAVGGYYAIRGPAVATPAPAPSTPAPPAPPPTVATAPDAGAPAVAVAPEEVETPPTASIAELLETGDAALRAGEAESALASYRAVVDLDAHDPYGHAGAARALLLLNRASEAVSYASRAVAHRQRRATFRVLLGDAYEANGEHARAVAEWRTALELEPDGEARSRLHE